MKRKCLCAALAVSCAINVSFAQVRLQGKVVDESNEPIPGANIRVSESLNGTTTDADYQWKEILENAVAFCIPKNDKAVQPILENVPNFYDNTPTTPLAVVHKGKATLLYCGFDLTPDTPVVRQLKNSLGCFLSGKA